MAIPGLPNPLGFLPNPFEYLRDALVTSIEAQGADFQAIVMQPPPVLIGSPADYLYGNAIGFAGQLTVLVAVVVTMLTIVHKKSAHRIPKAIGAAVVIGAFTPGWFAFTDFLINVGNELSEVAQFYRPPPGGGQSSPSSVPLIVDLVGGTVGYAVVGALRQVVMWVMLAYAVIIVVVKFGMLFAVALFAFSQKLFYWMVAAGLTAMVFGRPAAILMMELLAWAGDIGLFQNTISGATFYIICGLILALAAQVGVYKGLKKAINNIVGNVRSYVTGTVKSIAKRRSPQQIAAMGQRAHLNSNSVQKLGTARAPLGKRMVQTTRDQLVVHGARKVAGTRIVAGATPHTAAVIAGGVAASKIAQRIPRGRRHVPRHRRA